MKNRHASEWPHTTCLDFLSHPHDIVGIDLFDETIDGIPMTSIYQRFADGARNPARTVILTVPDHAQSVIEAWSRKGEVRDFREATVGKPWSGMSMRVAKANVQALVKAVMDNRAAIEREYNEAIERHYVDNYLRNHIAIVKVESRPRSVVVHVANTKSYRSVSVNTVSDAIAKFVPNDLGVYFPSWG